eukprot:SAG31_NODE_1335_length_8749_cov_3.813426_2_plen_60_part_00
MYADELNELQQMLLLHRPSLVRKSECGYIKYTQKHCDTALPAAKFAAAAAAVERTKFGA